MGDKGLRRTPEQIERDKGVISNLMLKSYPTREMARHLSQVTNKDGYTVSHMTIHKHVKEILAEWKEQRKDLINNLIERELGKLDVIEFEAWQAWEASKNGKSRTKVVGGQIKNGTIINSDPGSAERIIENTNGDPRYFAVILQCMDKRRELLGYGAAKKVEHSGSVTIGVANLDESEMRKEKERMLSNMLKKKGVALPLS